MFSKNFFIKPIKRPVDWHRIRLLILDCDGVLTDGKIIYGTAGMDIKHFDAHDGMGFMLLRMTDVKVAIITGRSSEALISRCKDLHIEHLFQGVSDKLGCMNDLLDELGLSQDQVVYMGDDWNDAACMRRVAFSAVPANALPEIKKIADHVTQAYGGHGAVRELINYILTKKGTYEKAVLDFLKETNG